MSDERAPDRRDPSTARAVRLIIRYEGDDITLESRHRLNMTVPVATQMDLSDEARSGYWIEVRDATGDALVRQPLHDPIPRDTEVFSDDPERSVARIPSETTSGVFTVLVPDLDAADHVALMGIGRSTTRSAAAEATPRELARFDLHD